MPLDFPSNPTNGQVYDTYVYDSSIASWRSQGSTNNLGVQIAALQLANATTNKSGLVPVIPSSVSVGSGSGSYDSATGLITFSGASNLSVDGVFTSAYRNYRIVAYGITSSVATDIQGRFRTAGSTNTNNVYYTGASIQRADGVSSVYSGFNGINYTVLCPATVEVGWSGFIWDIYQPAVSTVQTTSHFNATGYQTAIQNRQGSIMFNQAQTVDGFHLYPTTTSNIGGQIKVYGYN